MQQNKLGLTRTQMVAVNADSCRCGCECR